MGESGAGLAPPLTPWDLIWIDRRQSIKPDQDATNEQHGEKGRHVPHLPTAMSVKLIWHACRSKPDKRESFAGRDMIPHKEGLTNSQNPKADGAEQIDKAQKVYKVVQNFSKHGHRLNRKGRSVGGRFVF